MSYFTPDFMAFLNDLSENNEKEWFHANKKRYENSVKKPFNEFVGVMIERVAQVTPTVEILPKEALFRINRDIRFSKDKRPYKTHLGAVISEGGRKNMQVPGLYFHFGASEIMIAGGSHAPDKQHLYKIREAIVEDPDAISKIVQAPKFKSLLGELRGDKNKILPKEFKETMGIQPLIANKSFHYVAEYQDPSILLRDDLPEWIMSHYHAGLDLVNYLKKALGM